MVRTDHTDVDDQNDMRMAIALQHRTKWEEYQILRTVVWIEKWMEVSALRGGSVTSTSGTNV
jgi:hypothetical protein